MTSRKRKRVTAPIPQIVLRTRSHADLDEAVRARIDCDWWNNKPKRWVNEQVSLAVFKLAAELERILDTGEDNWDESTRPEYLDLVIDAETPPY